MKLITSKQLKDLVPLSSQRIWSLEQAGKFPRRLKTGTARTAKALWVLAEVEDWIAARLKERSD